jgi:hypothetical protein
MCWLNTEYNKQLRDFVNNERICHFDQSFGRALHAICIMMDRVDDSAEWLNQHPDIPKDAAEFLLFLVYSDIIIKTIRKVIDKLNISSPYKNSPSAREFLSNLCSKGGILHSKINTPDDEMIWSYLRALAFAHTEETAAKRYRGSFLQEDEIQYSPFPMVDKDKKEVGVTVYSSLKGYTGTFMLPYEALKRFVLSRFELISEIVRLAKKRIKEHERKLQKDVIEEGVGPIAMLRNLRKKYVERFDSICAGDFDFALMCLTCQTSLSKNEDKVTHFRRALESAIPNAVRAFNRLEYEECLKHLNDICCREVQGVSNSVSYQLQTVFSHLKRGDDKYEIAKQCVVELMPDVLSKYVEIDVDVMLDDEIKMLITVACYFYRQEFKNSLSLQE